MKDLFIDIERNKLGLYALEDETNAPIGSFRVMRNVQVTDRGGIAPRPGVELLGSDNTAGYPTRGAYNFVKSFAQNEIILKPYNNKIEIYSKNNPEAGWFTLKTGFTADKEFGMVTSLVNQNNQDYVIFCNRFDDYMTWTGAVTQLAGALVGAETEITVDTTLEDEIYYSGTATSNSATTVDVSTVNWGASQWVNLFVYFPSTGKIRKITANTSTQITFDTLGAGPGNIAFEVRKLIFADVTGSVIYNGTVIAYTGIDVYNKLTVGSAHAAADNSGLAEIPTPYPSAPRGNRLANYLARIVVGNVRSAIARDSGGAYQGYSAAGSYFVSKQKIPTDFGYSATRVAGEGDIVGTPYGGGNINDVIAQEDGVYIFKDEYVEQCVYSQDANDLANRVPLKTGVGSVGKTIRGSDDVYFMTKDNKFTSIGRVKTKDIKPQTENIAFPIKRYLDTWVKDEICGFEDNDKLYFSVKTASAAQNDITVIYSKRNKSFEGVWDIGANSIFKHNGNSYFGESSGANVYKLFSGTADVKGTERLPIASDCISNFINVTPSKHDMQALCGIYFEGYITAATTVKFKLFKQFETSPFLQFNFTGNETGLLDGTITGSFLGQTPQALQPLGVFSDPDQTGRRHFQFTVYFPFQYANYFSVGWESSGTDLDYEISRYGLMLKEDISVNTAKIKNV